MIANRTAGKRRRIDMVVGLGRTKLRHVIPEEYREQFLRKYKFCRETLGLNRRKSIEWAITTVTISMEGDLEQLKSYELEGKHGV
jgi:hypothetical protein